MANYLVVCTDQRPLTSSANHAHVVAIGTGPNLGSYWDAVWPLQTVLDNMGPWTQFYTLSPSSGRTAWVHKAYCPECGHDVIVSAPDAIYDNNLDALPRTVLV